MAKNNLIKKCHKGVLDCGDDIIKGEFKLSKINGFYTLLEGGYVREYDAFEDYCNQVISEVDFDIFAEKVKSYIK